MPEDIDVRSKEYQKSLLKELRKVSENVPEPQQDWDLIWVLSGPQVTFQETPEHGRNETRERLITGFSLVRQIVAVRLGKNPGDLTQEEVQENGPKVYFNGTNDMNDALRRTQVSGILEDEYQFPRQNLIVGPNEDITRTQEQFQKFPQELSDGSRKIVLVTDAYHLLRVPRYAAMDYNPIPLDKLIYYPYLPIKFPLATTAHEVKNKVPEYVAKGFFPKYPPTKNK